MGFLSNKIWVRIFLGHPVLSSVQYVQYICSRRILGSNMVAPINFGTHLTHCFLRDLSHVLGFRFNLHFVPPENRTIFRNFVHGINCKRYGRLCLSSVLNQILLSAHGTSTVEAVKNEENYIVCCVPFHSNLISYTLPGSQTSQSRNAAQNCVAFLLRMIKQHLGKAPICCAR